MAKRFGLKIIESNAQIEAILLKKLASMAAKHFSSAYKKLLSPLRTMVRDTIMNTQEDVEEIKEDVKNIERIIIENR